MGVGDFNQVSAGIEPRLTEPLSHSTTLTLINSFVFVHNCFFLFEKLLILCLSLFSAPIEIDPLYRAVTYTEVHDNVNPLSFVWTHLSLRLLGIEPQTLLEN